MAIYKQIFFFVLFGIITVFAQEEKLKPLEEVLVSDGYLKNNSSSHLIHVLSDTILKSNRSSLTSLLHFNSTIYFKENGLGMISSPSFRGTTASQTAVIWNGININSPLNGQTDFNTISTKTFSSISIRSGGGSAIYGSSAIGGSIHLNNKLVFTKRNTHDLQLEYGSFATHGLHYNAQISSSKTAFEIGVSRNSSLNDYEYIGRYNWKGEQLKNENGQYMNVHLGLNFGLQINQNQNIKFYSQTSFTDRNFSLLAEKDTKTKYKTQNSKGLIEYENKLNRLVLNGKTFYATEKYEYYGDISKTEYSSSGNVNTYLVKADIGYKINNHINLNTLADYQFSRGYGTSLTNQKREITSVAILLKNNFKKWQNDGILRKEITNSYLSPLLFSIGSSYHFNPFYQTKINFSRNFRIPTFNDLYYDGGGGKGNPNLKPESSYQAEWSNVLHYKKASLTQTLYAIKIKDLISWVPLSTGGTSPLNTDKVFSYGAETAFDWSPKIGNHTFQLNANYAYTISQNEETKKQLLYVPFHKFTSSLVYHFSSMVVQYQFLYNGFVYQLSDNRPNQTVKAYSLSNVLFSYAFCKEKKISFAWQLHNLFNQKYESIAGRYMPGRNFNLSLNYKY